jgi:hypothetical protein
MIKNGVQHLIDDAAERPAFQATIAMSHHHDQHDMLARGDLDDRLGRRAKLYLKTGSYAGRAQLRRLVACDTS